MLSCSSALLSKGFGFYNYCGVASLENVGGVLLKFCYICETPLIELVLAVTGQAMV